MFYPDHVMSKKKFTYSFSHNHGSVENGCICKVSILLVIIMGGRVLLDWIFPDDFPPEEIPTLAIWKNPAAIAMTPAQPAAGRLRWFVEEFHRILLPGD